MTRKQFQIIANIIAAMPTHKPSLRAQKRSCALAFANGLAKENPRFNLDKFLAACGEGSEE